MNTNIEKKKIIQHSNDSREEPRVFPQWMCAGNQQRFLHFEGSVRVLCTEEAMNTVCDEIDFDSEIKERVIGFDCEWDVKFSSGRCEQQKVAVIQICVSKRHCFVFHLSCLNYKMPDKLKALITNHRILKAGVNVDADIYKLDRDYDVQSDVIVAGNKRSTVDLSEFANNVFFKKESWSLQGLSEYLLKFSLRKDKNVRLSKWSECPLSKQQIEYAVCDAYASLLLYHKIKQQKERSERPNLKIIQPES